MKTRVEFNLAYMFMYGVTYRKADAMYLYCIARSNYKYIFQIIEQYKEWKEAM